MNWSMYTVDRITHLKIVVVGLSAALLISVIGIAVQQLNLGTDIMTAQGPHRDQGWCASDLHRPQPSGYPLEVTRAPPNNKTSPCLTPRPSMRPRMAASLLCCCWARCEFVRSPMSPSLRH